MALSPEDQDIVRLMSVLDELSDGQRALLELLAVSGGEVSYTTTVALKHLEIKHGKRDVTTVSARKLAGQLVKRGLLDRNQRTLLGDDKHLEHLLRAILRRGDFRAISEAFPRWRGNFYSPHYTNRSQESDRARYGWELREPLYLDDLVALKNGFWAAISPPDVTDWVTRPLERDLLESLSAPMRGWLAPHLLAREIAEAEANPRWAATLATITSAGNTPETIGAQAYWDFLCGDFEACERATKDMNPVDKYSVEGMLALARGDQKTSAKAFLKALKGDDAPGFKKDRYLGPPAGLLAVIALTGTNKTNTKRAATQVRRMLEGGMYQSGPLQRVLWPMRRLVDASAATKIPRKLAAVQAHPLAVLFDSLVKRWDDQPVEAKAIDRAIDRSKAVGWHWVTSELQTLTGKRSAIDGTFPLVDLRQVVPLWQRQLDAFRVALGSASSPSDGPDNRVIWRIGYVEGRLSLDAVTQARKKRGGWTVGRGISMKRLFNEQSAYPELDEYDRRVLVHLAKESNWHYQDSYEWKPSVWTALVGHPRLYSAVTEKPVTVAEAKPHLKVAVAEGEAMLTVEPKMTETVRVTTVGTEGYEVLSYTKEQRDVAALIGDGLRVPKKEKRQLEVIANQLSGSFASVTGAKRRKGNSTPVLQLRPTNDGGLQVRICVRPGGSKSRALVPGLGGKEVLLSADGTAIRVRRNLKKELELAQALVERAPSLNQAEWDGEQYQLFDLPSVLTLLEELQQASTDDDGPAFLVEWPEGEPLRLRSSTARTLGVRVETRGDWFEVSGKMVVDEGLTLSLGELLKLASQGSSRFLKLEDGSFVALERRVRRQLDALSRVAQRDREKVSVHRLVSEPLSDLLGTAQQTKSDEGWKTFVRDGEVVLAAPETPASLTASLRPYQRDAFVWLTRLAALRIGACLADDMGLGKTIVSLAVLLQRASLGPALVVVPTSVEGNWKREAWRFAPTLKLSDLRAGERASTVAELGPSDVLVCSYGLLVSESDALATRRWSTVILDEAQAIKNPATQRHKAAVGLEADFRVTLTGTPIQNHLGELHALLSFLNPGMLGSEKSFRTRFTKPMSDKDGDGGRGRDARQQLSKVLGKVVLRRTKSQVLDDLPSRTEVDLLVAPSEMEVALHEALRREALAALAAGSEKPGPAHLQILTHLTKMRLAACHPGLVRAKGMPEIASSKLAAFGELVEQLSEGGHRALVFSQFVKHLALIREWLDAREITYQYLDGATPIKQRDKRVAAFQAGEGDVFLISLKAGGVGLNLTAADYVIHVDPWWNPAIEDQASDRAHRIGQTRPVTIYRLIAQGTIEEKIIKLHRDKRDLADRVLSGTDAAAALSAEELLQLIQQPLEGH